MTGREIFEKALRMLGYIEQDGTVDSSLNYKALTIINAVYADIYFLLFKDGFMPLLSLSEKINLDERILHDVFPYGVAMHISLGEGDGLNQQVFSTIYNSKRCSVNTLDTRSDILPSVSE